MHARMEPVRHRFKYPVYCYAFDLDELETLDREIGWFGYNRKRPVSIHDRDYLHSGEGTIKEKLFTFLTRYGCHEGVNRVELLTCARYFNYVFNPVSFYYCYNNNDDIRCVVAEVNNTFDERHLYILTQPLDAKRKFARRYTVNKDFHVSPFNDMKGDYDFHFSTLGESMDIRINIVKDQRNVFYSRHWGNSQPLTHKNLRSAIIRYPITAWLTMPRILKEAAMLYYRKHLPVFSKPNPESALTIRVAEPTTHQRFCMSMVMKMLSTIREGRLIVKLPNGVEHVFGSSKGAPNAVLNVHNYEFFKRVLYRGDIGFGESFVEGDWDSDDVTQLIYVFITNMSHFDDKLKGVNTFSRLYSKFKHMFRKNTKRGSRKNIHAHYDISNAFYETFLDPSMMYSCGIYSQRGDTLADAQQNKIQVIIDKAQLTPNDHVLEIGSGWGGFAIEAVRQSGCRVTTVTVSKQQYEYAQRRINEAGLQDRIDIRLCDYRELEGQYDKIVSIEMIEAVGHEYLGTFFKTCDRVLKPNGLMVLQVITIPDQRYDDYRQQSDWIQQYIFPGAVVPSLTALCNAMTTHSNLIINQLENIGIHYAHTLADWRTRMNSANGKLEQLGLDNRFKRMWNYYFSYCEAGFASRFLNNLQLVLTRQANRQLVGNIN